ncbi:MAG: class C sortase [Ruminococcus sp.]|nr:class C sortase [Ruminococcus sp.]
MSKKKKGILSTIFLLLMLLVGLSVMLYPTISDWWNSRVQSRAVAGYEEAVKNMTPEDYSRYFTEAEDYNRRLLSLAAPFASFDEVEGYDDALNISNTGIMGYITIPCIKVELPIYHGTSPEVLNIAAGHLQGSSLPVGGENTHAVISAHRGLPSARLFTDLDQLDRGDLFTITVLDRVFTYEVEDIYTVKPEQVDKLAIIPGGDYVTLMTCTPYGINTHRLLIRSRRTDNVEKHDVRIFADMVKVDPMLVIPFIAAPLFLVLLGFWLFGGRRKQLKPREIAECLVNERKGDRDDRNQ